MDWSRREGGDAGYFHADDTERDGFQFPANINCPLPPRLGAERRLGVNLSTTSTLRAASGVAVTLPDHLIDHPPHSAIFIWEAADCYLALKHAPFEGHGLPRYRKCSGNTRVACRRFLIHPP